MAISRRADYATNDILVYDELNRWSINGSPQYLTHTVMSGATTQPFHGVFNMYPVTTYSHFKIIINKLTTSLDNLQLNMKLHSTFIPGLGPSTYDQAYQNVVYNGGALSYNSGTGLSAWSIVRNTNSSAASSAIIDVFNPFVALTVTGISKISSDSLQYSTSSGRYANSNAFDGFELSLSGAGTMTGTVTVYALRNGNA